MSVILDDEKYMTIEEVKAKLNKHLGNKVRINYNLGRNKFEQYEAVIKELYNSIFIVELENEIKSFSYSDVITRTIKIKY